jgi:hypothetical protein
MRLRRSRLVMLEVGSRNEAALAVMATATASRPADRPWRQAACRATGMATTTATSRLTSALSSAVRVRMPAAAMTRAPRAGMSARARSANAPVRPASAEARIITARVTNGLAVAVAAVAAACGTSAAVMTARMLPAAQIVTRRGS